jgi:trans-2,3-dihydro-3-hydroxyanthranilate isomerase
MQAIAREMNLSETVFFQKAREGGHAKLRIFTPRRELPFAGHPVLGSAWILAGPMEMNQLRLETGAGMIPVDIERAGDRLHVAFMTQPLPQFSPIPAPENVYQALGVVPSPSWLAPVLANNGPSHILLDVGSQETLEALKPDYSHLARLTESGVYAFAQQESTVHARYFAPAAGILEDPATGSAAGPLGAYLVREQRIPERSPMTVHQGAAMLRPSVLLVSVRADGKQVTEVRVGGAAVVIARGELQIP